MGTVSLTDRMAFLQHPLRERAKVVVRVAARVDRDLADEDDLVDILVEMTKDLSPRAFDQFVELTMATSEMSRGGADSAPKIVDAAMRAAQEDPDLDEEGRGYLFALPIIVRGPTEPKYLKKSLTKAEQGKIVDLLRSSEMVGDGEVLILPRLLTVQQTAFMTIGQVNRLKQLLSNRKFPHVYAAAAEASQSLSADELEHTKVTDALETAAGLRTVVLVGMVYCDDPYDPPFPLARALVLADRDAPGPTHPEYFAVHVQMRDERIARKIELADKLARIFQAETTVLMEADGWSENLGEICEIQRAQLFAESVTAMMEEWGLVSPADLQATMPDHHVNGSPHFLIKSSRGDERKFTWLRLPDEHPLRTVVKLIECLADNEITRPEEIWRLSPLPPKDLLGMLSGGCDVDQSQGGDERGHQSGGPGRRGTLH